MGYLRLGRFGNGRDASFVLRPFRTGLASAVFDFIRTSLSRLSIARTDPVADPRQPFTDRVCGGSEFRILDFGAKLFNGVSDEREVFRHGLLAH
jgi:hypothetical protein